MLVDTGFGLRDVASTRARLSRCFVALTSPEFREGVTAVRQRERLDVRCATCDVRRATCDVRYIVLSHLDFDHAGGLDEFPHARLFRMRACISCSTSASAMAPRTQLDRMRYRPQQWSTRGNWITCRPRGEPWHGFDRVRELNRVRELKGLLAGILLAPLAAARSAKQPSRCRSANAPNARCCTRLEPRTTSIRG